FDDFTMSITPGGAPDCMSYFNDCCTSLSPQLYDFTYAVPEYVDKINSRKDMLQWRCSSFTIPECDSFSKSSAFMQMTLTGGTASPPRDVHLNADSYSKFGVKQKAWLCSNFRLSINGIDCSHVSLIEPLTISMRVEGGNDGTPPRTVCSCS